MYSVERSPQKYARICGWHYLLVIAAGIFGLVASSRIVVSGDAAATASHIQAFETLWRLGFASNIFAGACYVAVTLILYVLLRPAHRNLSLLAAFFSLVGCAIGGVATLGQIAPLLLLGDADYLKSVDPHLLQVLALLSIHLSGYGTQISLIFFGFYCFLIGYLIFGAGYFPKTLGVLLVIGGLCYVIDSFAYFVAPTIDAKLSPYILAPPGIAELSLCLWLIVMGVNVPRWNERQSR
jgi:Domain of unknown function (DUF4386)